MCGLAVVARVPNLSLNNRVLVVVTESMLCGMLVVDPVDDVPAGCASWMTTSEMLVRVKSVFGQCECVGQSP